MSLSRMTLAAVVLENPFVRLEPFAPALEAEVRAALDCEEASWDIMVGAAYGLHFDGWWRSALNAMARDPHRLGRPPHLGQRDRRHNQPV